VSAAEHIEEFACFGSTCSVRVIGDGDAGSPEHAVALAKRALLTWHERFSRFLPDSELSALNRDPRAQVQASALMTHLALAVRTAGATSGGLVDATLVEQIERAGYTDAPPRQLPLREALRLAPARAPAAPAPDGGWRHVGADVGRGLVMRPAGVKIDSGGLAKGLFADTLAQALSNHASFAVDCAGDLTIGGAASRPRAINVQSPFDGSILHTFELASTGVATSGIGRRSWSDASGAPMHHLLDPASGRPAFTGVVQVTAFAPSALLAEIHAKAAVLSGPRGARKWLRHGGLIVFDDGSHELVAPPPQLSVTQLSKFAAA
jgi:FAD:protein FMN transferase